MTHATLREARFLPLSFNISFRFLKHRPFDFVWSLASARQKIQHPYKLVSETDTKLTPDT